MSSNNLQQRVFPKKNGDRWIQTLDLSRLPVNHNYKYPRTLSSARSSQLQTHIIAIIIFIQNEIPQSQTRFGLFLKIP